jgi:hypothetical protein
MGMDTLQFGTAVRDITPGKPTWAHGYAARSYKSSGVREPLSLGCLVASDGQTRVLIVTLDMIGVRMDVCDDLYALLEKEVGIGYPNVMISGSHTHFASALHTTTFSNPDVGFVEPDEDYVAAVKTKLIEAAREALGNLRPLRLEVARIKAPQVVFNRRTVRKDDGMVEMNLMYPEDASSYTFSPVDDELTIHRLVDESGVHAVLVNFGCHPVTGCSPQEDYYRFSADYPYYVRQTNGDAWHCPVFFTLGAAGDAVPINRRDDCRERIGSILGHSAVLAERMFGADALATVAADSVVLEAETILKTNASTAQAEYEEARRAVLAADKQDDDYRALLTTFQKKMAALYRSRLYPDNKAQLKVQFIQIGETTLVGVPFEVLSEIGLKMKERFPNSVMVSCCGGYQGYLPLAYEYDRGGYEATASSTHFVPGTGDRILEVILDKLSQGVARERRLSSELRLKNSGIFGADLELVK